MWVMLVEFLMTLEQSSSGLDPCGCRRSGVGGHPVRAARGGGGLCHCWRRGDSHRGNSLMIRTMAVKDNNGNFLDFLIVLIVIFIMIIICSYYRSRPGV